MKRTRKWGFVAQEASRLAALGLKPLDIAKRLGVNKSTVTRWMADGKLRRSTAPKPTTLVVQANQTPAAWAAAVRKDYDLDVTDDQLVMLAEAALAVSMDATVSPQVRMTSSGRFQALVRQLSLVTRGAATVAAPAAKAPEQKKNPRVHRPHGDPRTLLMAVK